MTITKLCNECLCEKPLTFFYNRDAKCKACRVAIFSERRRERKAKQREELVKDPAFNRLAAKFLGMRYERT